MNILIVEDDLHLSKILSGVLAHDAHSVITVSESGTALDLVSTSLPDVLIVNAQLPGVSGIDLVRLVRRRPDGERLAIMVMTAFPDDRLRKACLELKVEKLLVKPFSVLDLSESIRGVALAQHPPAPESARASLDIGNVAHVVRLWARKANGILQIERPPFSAWVTFAGGAPVDAEGISALQVALSGGDLEFQPCDVDGAGDTNRLATLLWTRAREEVLPGDCDTQFTAVASPNRLTDSASQLPLPDALREMLPHLQNATPLTALADAADVELRSVIADVVALANLGLLTLQVPRPSPRLTTRMSMPAPPRPTPVAHVSTPASPPPEPDDAALKRLRREVQLLKDSDPWVVLGIPHEAAPELVARAGDRMLDRYTTLQNDKNPEVRELATQLLTRVQGAIAELTSPVISQVHLSPSEEHFRAGQRAMAAGDWTLADRWFTAARDLEMDSPRNLAHLGWVRFHNPDLPLGERVAEGLDLLRLAEQFDPAYAEGQYFLAMALHRQGDDDGAMRRVRRALKAQPDHVAASALGRKLRKPAQ